MIIGASEQPCLILAVGARDRSTGPDWGVYTIAEAAQLHGAGGDTETTAPAEAYARFPSSKLTSYRDGWLSGIGAAAGSYEQRPRWILLPG